MNKKDKQIAKIHKLLNETSIWDYEEIIDIMLIMLLNIQKGMKGIVHKSESCHKTIKEQIRLIKLYLKVIHSCTSDKELNLIRLRLFTHMAEHLEEWWY